MIAMRMTAWATRLSIWGRDAYDSEDDIDDPDLELAKGFMPNLHLRYPSDMHMRVWAIKEQLQDLYHLQQCVAYRLRKPMDELGAEQWGHLATCYNHLFPHQSEWYQYYQAKNGLANWAKHQVSKTLQQYLAANPDTKKKLCRCYCRPVTNTLQSSYRPCHRLMEVLGKSLEQCAAWSCPCAAPAPPEQMPHLD